MDVHVSHLHLDYGDFVAVKDLDLTIPNGESVVLLGKSGCGKTTTMRCIAGLEEPTGGSISIGGKPVFDTARKINVPSYKRNVGMVFQSYAVWPHKTVVENVAFPMKLKKVGAEQRRKRATEILELVGLAHLADRGASKLSGGQMQRVALARSIAMEPSVLLLDEPLSNLDASLRDDLRIELRAIQQEQGLTTLYVTHDQHEAFALGDRVAIMQEGYITQLADPITLYHHPRSATIASFIGVSNVFSIESVDGRGTATLRGHRLPVPTTLTRLDQPSSICIRPDVVHVSSENTRLDGERIYEATVQVALFQGPSYRYKLQLDTGPRLEAVMAAEGNSFHTPGERVQVSFRPEDVQVLVDDIVPRVSREGQEVAA